MKLLLYFFMTSAFTIGSCGIDDKASNQNNVKDELNIDRVGAKIVSVAVTGETPNLTFNVGIESPDTGCDQYANWWEVITENGELIYRRILGHSHVTEQPFVRSGSGINVLEDQVLIIRGHMKSLGYGTQVYKGTISSGFSQAIIEADFAADLATQSPLPSDCAF